MFNRIIKLPLDGKSSIFLFGPRGTGKTSWIKSHVPNDIYLDLLTFDAYAPLQANPSRLEEIIPAGYKGWVVIDEVQKIPELLNEVHRLIEHKKIRFLLTGSSARSLRRRGVNLLAGRALTYTMHPLVIQEMGDQFSLTHALNYGLLPGAFGHESPEKYLASYVQTYIREEVLQEGLTRNIASFTRFLEIASFSQGQLLNMSEIARELFVNRQIVASYFDILDDLLIGLRLLPFTKRAKRKMVAHQKFYFFDAGVFKTVRPKGPFDSEAETDGAGLETLFLQSLRAINDYYELGYQIYFWRTSVGDEVDFVLYGPRGLHAFEIKRTTTITPKMLKSIKLFHEDYPEAKLHVVHGGKLREYHGPITVINIVDALKELPEILK